MMLIQISQRLVRHPVPQSFDCLNLTIDLENMTYE